MQCLKACKSVKGLLQNKLFLLPQDMHVLSHSIWEHKGKVTGDDGVWLALMFWILFSVCVYVYDRVSVVGYCSFAQFSICFTHIIVDELAHLWETFNI